MSRAGSRDRAGPPGRSRATAAFLIGLAAAAMAAPARAEEAEPAPGGAQQTKPMADPLSQIQGSAENWYVSNDEDGCYLMSPYRRESSRVAIGRHPKFGVGLFMVNLGIATRGPDGPVPIVIDADGGELAKTGRMVGPALLLARLDPTEIEAVLTILGTNNGLWVTVQGTAISHEGQDASTAIAAYESACAAPPASPVAAPGAASGGKPGAPG